MKKLIVNGDDFGLTPGVNEGIIRAHREGILTSATLMANGAAFEDAVERAQGEPKLSVGCHLVLVGGRPVASPGSVPSLAGSQGRLPASLGVLMAKIGLGMIQGEDLERELRAQIERICRAGIRPSHVDTHKHAHVHPRVMEALARVARENGITRVRKPFESPVAATRNGIPFRQRVLTAVASRAAPSFRRLAASYGLSAPDHFFGLRRTGRMGGAAILELIAHLPEGTSELMCHPGLCDADLVRELTRLKREREIELEGLLDPGVRRALSDHGIVLIGYAELN